VAIEGRGVTAGRHEIGRKSPQIADKFARQIGTRIKLTPSRRLVNTRPVILVVKRHNGDSSSGFLLGLLDSSVPIDDDGGDQNAAEILRNPRRVVVLFRSTACTRLWDSHLRLHTRLRLVMRFILVIPVAGLREEMEANAAAKYVR